MVSGFSGREILWRRGPLHGARFGRRPVWKFFRLSEFRAQTWQTTVGASAHGEMDSLTLQSNTGNQHGNGSHDQSNAELLFFPSTSRLGLAGDWITFFAQRQWTQDVQIS